MTALIEPKNPSSNRKGLDLASLLAILSVGLTPQSFGIRLRQPGDTGKYSRTEEQQDASELAAAAKRERRIERNRKLYYNNATDA